MRDVVENEIEIVDGAVWRFTDQNQINYSEGKATEDYLSRVLRNATDLSSGSYELGKWARDWPTTYHLSRRRANLLRGFRFDPSKTVLEVGCGCGAITRFLGETFEQVTAIEGSLTRAKLARLRTKDLENVSLLAAPIQDVKFKVRFDMVFCIGVLEYAGAYIDAADPYDYFLRWLSACLKEDGVAVIAIENQFGLKYFASSREDHNGVMFDGLEGYPRHGGKIRTFGYDELKERIAKYFPDVKFYFPYPDYKLPSSVLSEELFNRVNAGELVGKSLSQNRTGHYRPLFDERLVLAELAKNQKLPFFSNSFLVTAGKKTIISTEFPDLGVIYSTERVPEFQTVTTLVAQDARNVRVKKVPSGPTGRTSGGPLLLRACESRWIHVESLQAALLRRCKRERLTLSELFEPCKRWIDMLLPLAFEREGRKVIPGEYLDWIFSNAYLHNGICEFVDRELEWKDDIPMNVLVVRALYYFLLDASSLRRINPNLRLRSTKRVIKRAAASLGICLSRTDFRDFCKLEARLGHTVFGSSLALGWLSANLFLLHPSALSMARRTRRFVTKVGNLPRRIVRHLA